MGVEFDLIVKAGRAFCADTGLDGPGAVAIRDGRIVASGPDVGGPARETLDFPDCLLLPGLVDMHTHPAPSSWKYGIDPDVEILPRGTTTILSQGDSGAAHWPVYRDTVIRGSKTRVRLAISAATNGETGEPGKPCFENIDDLDVDATVAAIDDAGDHIWGVSVNVSQAASGKADPRMVLARTVEMAERTDRPILFGERWEPHDWPISEQLDALRPGDVVTYCFHASPNGIVENGRVIDAVWKARQRGVLFDIGHGMASFDFKVAEAAIADGFLPDTISTDQYARHVGSKPQHDLLRTLSKLLASGTSEADAFDRVTRRPAEILGLAGEVGTLAPGASADLCIARWNGDALPLVDVAGDSRPGGCYEPELTVRAGEIVGGS
jgi:dihydroorotase